MPAYADTPAQLYPGATFEHPELGVLTVADVADAIDNDHRTTGIDTVEDGIVQLDNDQPIRLIETTGG